MCSSKREQPPAIHGCDVVDAVAEDETAVQHADLGLRDRQVLAVQVAQVVGHRTLSEGVERLWHVQGGSGSDPAQDLARPVIGLAAVVHRHAAVDQHPADY